MTAALIPRPDAPDETDGLALLLATEQGTAYGPITRVADLPAGVEAVDTSAADALLVVVVSTLQGGDSVRPTLCIGDPDEVASCRLAAGSGAGGAGPADGAEEAPGGCGCRAAGATGAWGSGRWLAATLGALALYGRRRRRAR
jgi:MYXO-CTERM domain-containing protein